MHDDDNLRSEGQMFMRHNDPPVSIKQMLHDSLDRLLAQLIAQQETMGAASVTIMQTTDEMGDFAGQTFVVALDLDARPENYEELEGEWPDHS